MTKLNKRTEQADSTLRILSMTRFMVDINSGTGLNFIDMYDRQYKRNNSYCYVCSPKTASELRVVRPDSDIRENPHALDGYVYMMSKNIWDKMGD